MRTDPATGNADLDISWQSGDDHGIGQADNVPVPVVKAILAAACEAVGHSDREVRVFTTEQIEQLKKILHGQCDDAWETIAHLNRRVGPEHPMTQGAGVLAREMNELLHLIYGPDAEASVDDNFDPADGG